MEKRKPTYDIDAIKSAIGSLETLAITTSALRDATALGFDRGGIVEVVRSATRKMFVKSMTPSQTIASGTMSITCRHVA